MIRPISAAGLRELFARESAHVLLAAVTFDHEMLAEPVRLVNDMQALQHNGQTYMALPFELTLPPDSEDEVPALQLKIDNVDRSLAAILRSVTDPPSVDVEILRVDEAGTVTSEMGPLSFSLLDASIGAAAVTLKIGYLVDVLNEPATKEIFNPSLAPGLFR
ncbi:DUF1833 family protein [Alloalcanivorax sp. C16-1]|uniref:DUF1833 family protein n=1 Tax=Alloalcanivorax sp. C16-1 TaxID=3390051 RepID=UPI003970E242